MQVVWRVPHSNPTLCNKICLNFLHSQVVVASAQITCQFSLLNFLPTAREGIVFTCVCHSVHNQPYGYSVTAHPYHSAVGTHPTGMLSCLFCTSAVLLSFSNLFLLLSFFSSLFLSSSVSSIFFVLSFCFLFLYCLRVFCVFLWK